MEYKPVPRPNLSSRGSPRGSSIPSRGSFRGQVPRPNLTSRGQGTRPNSPSRGSLIRKPSLHESIKISSIKESLDFEIIPDEMIVQMCENMEFEELGRFIQTSKRNYRVCHDILNKRNLDAISSIYFLFPKDTDNDPDNEEIDIIDEKISSSNIVPDKYFRGL